MISADRNPGRIITHRNLTDGCAGRDINDGDVIVTLVRDKRKRRRSDGAWRSGAEQ